MEDSSTCSHSAAEKAPSPSLGEHCTTEASIDPSLYPTGEIIKLGNLDAYISRPAEPATAKLLLFLSNAAGVRAINNQAHADQFAREGFLVIMPDIFDGDPVPTTATFSTEEMDKLPLLDRIRLTTAEGIKRFIIDIWLARHTAEKTMPLLERIMSAIKETYPDNVENGMYAIGYCFGGKYVLKLAATDDIKAGALAHGTLVTLEDIKAVKQPVLLACVEEDPFFPDDVRESGRIFLEEMGIPNEFRVYEGVPHGFAVLGHENRIEGCKPEEAEAIKTAYAQAQDQMLHWLTLY
ncbi:Alpha/Beta hydrolase protein [Kalaharituber pfeilii]|nr:Alpha/Beta hydrolase protein [Kalaharituber pfeilii]